VKNFFGYFAVTAVQSNSVKSENLRLNQCKCTVTRLLLYQYCCSDHNEWSNKEESTIRQLPQAASLVDETISAVVIPVEGPQSQREGAPKL